MWQLAIGGMVLVAIVHTVTGSGAVIPLYWQDEAGYLGNALVISGVDDPMQLSGRPYYIGWSLLIAPLWLIFGSGQEVYLGAIVLSTVCGVAVAVPLAFIARRLGLRTPVAIIVACVCSLAPQRALYANFAVAESLLALLVCFAVLAAMRWAQSPTVVNAIPFALASSGAFITHGRAIPLVIVTGLWFIVGLRRTPRASIVGLAVLGAVSAIGFMLYRSVVSELYPSASSREDSGIERLLDPNVIATVLSGIGQVWYVTFAWCGLSVVGAIVVVRALRSEVRRRQFGPALWGVLVFAGVALISFTFIADAIARQSGRVDVFSYGRYLDPFVAPLGLIGLTLIVRGLLRRVALITIGITAAIGAVWFIVVWPAMPKTGVQNWNPLNVTGTLQFAWPGTTWLPAAPWLYMSAFVLAALVVVLLLRRRPTVLIAILTLYFVASTVVGEFRIIRPFFSGWNASYQLDDTIVNDPLLHGQTVSLDLDGLHEAGDGVSKNAYQILLAPSSRVVFFNSRDSAPTTDLVISRKSWPVGELLGAKKIADDPGVFSNALWVMPGALQDSLEASGQLQ
jgi:hypothetical protein